MQHERGPRKPKLGSIKTVDGPAALNSPSKRSSSSTSSSPGPFSNTLIDVPIDLSTTPRLPYPIIPLTSLPKQNMFTQPEKIFQSPFDTAAFVNRNRIYGFAHGGPIFPACLETRGLIQESLQENSAKLLFTVVQWLRNVPSFMSLPSREQVIIIRLINYCPPL